MDVSVKPDLMMEAAVPAVASSKGQKGGAKGGQGGEKGGQEGTKGKAKGSKKRKAEEALDAAHAAVLTPKASASQSTSCVRVV